MATDSSWLYSLMRSICPAATYPRTAKMQFHINAPRNVHHRNAPKCMRLRPAGMEIS